MRHRFQCPRHNATTQCKIQEEINDREAVSCSMIQIHRCMSNNCWYDIASDFWALHQRLFLCRDTKDEGSTLRTQTHTCRSNIKPKQNSTQIRERDPPHTAVFTIVESPSVFKMVISHQISV
jgi:hypothetical protein